MSGTTGGPWSARGTQDPGGAQDARGTGSADRRSGTSGTSTGGAPATGSGGAFDPAPDSTGDTSRTTAARPYRPADPRRPPRPPRAAELPSPAPHPPHADAEFLDQVAAGALARIDAMRPCFRLPADVATDANPNTTLKPLGELAELADVVRTLHPRPALRALADDLFCFAWKETRGGELFAELVRGEPQATYPIELYGVFARAGLRNPAAEELMAATTGLRLWEVAREDHTRTLNILNAERRIGLPPHADFAEVLARTGLGSRPEPWALDLRTAYGITHDVFHATDWGRFPRHLPEHLGSYLRLWLPAWTASWLEERQWDLAGELLAVAACLPDAPYDPSAWRQLAAAQGSDGAVPETGDGPPERCTLEEAFTGCYHSTLVAAFAATLARTAVARTATAPPPDAPANGAAHAPAGRTPTGAMPSGNVSSGNVSSGTVSSGNAHTRAAHPGTPSAGAPPAESGRARGGSPRAEPPEEPEEPEEPQESEVPS